MTEPGLISRLTPLPVLCNLTLSNVKYLTQSMQIASRRAAKKSSIICLGHCWAPENGLKLASQEEGRKAEERTEGESKRGGVMPKWVNSH